MLTELRITNFAVIERLSLTIDSGFTVLTGETGTGKSLLIDAVALLVVIGDQMHPVAARAVASLDIDEWLLGDSHWLHPVRIRTYNETVKYRNRP